MAISVSVAGVSGWTGSAVAAAILDHDEFELVGAVARRTAGEDVAAVLGGEPQGVRISESVDESLAESVDVLIDYTHPDAVKRNVLTALSRGVRAVIGTSGLSAADFQHIETAALEADRGVIAAGNFSLTAALAKHFAGIAARHIPHWEILDYAHGHKPDAPSGTTRELAEYLESVATNRLGHPLEETRGVPGARGASIGGSQVHSVRLPGFVISFEALFGLPDERLSIRHDAGGGAGPYVSGTLLAAKRVMEVTGLVRGLDTLLFGETT